MKILQLRRGSRLSLTPEQEWLLVAGRLVTDDGGSVRPAPNCDEQELRLLVAATAAGLVCSFCAAPKPRWRYPTVAGNGFPEAFVLPGHQLGVAHPEWLACDACAELIAHTDRCALAQTSTERHFSASATVRDPHVYDGVAKVVRCIQDEFWRSRCGMPERVPSFLSQE